MTSLQPPASTDKAADTNGHRTYRDYAPVLKAAGIRNTIPLPQSRKSPPPIGFTGAEGKPVSDEQHEEWCETRGGDGIGFVLEDGYQGVDADNYAKGDRAAGVALHGIAEIEERTRCEYPPTACLFHRDDGSAKFLYRCTPGVKWRGEIAPGVEIISRGYRYVHAGINPDTGKPEQWGWGRPGGEIRPVDGPLPPEQWAVLPERLEAEHAEEDNGRLRSLATEAEAREYLDVMPDGPMSYYVRRELRQAIEDLSGINGSRHVRIRIHVRKLVQYGAAGLPGATTALATIERELTEERKLDPDRASDTGEFARMLPWAAKRVDPGTFNALRILDRNKGLIPNLPRTTEPNGETPAGYAVFKVMEPSEWAKPVEPTDFLIRRVLCRDTFGVNAGPKKSLKTHDNIAIAFAVATGQNLYMCDELPVVCGGRVLYIVGEGGENPTRRSLQRIGRAYGVDLAELQRDPSSPLVVAFGAAPLDSPKFRDEVKRMLDTYQPGLVLAESFYNFHPPDVQAGNLFERGQVIDDYHKFIRRECEGGGVVSLMTDHYRSTNTGKSLDLDNISMAAGRERRQLDHAVSPQAARRTGRRVLAAHGFW